MVKLFHRIVASVAAVSGSLWLGTRANSYTVGYDLFEPGTTVLRVLDPNVQAHIIRIWCNISSYSMILYALCLMSCITLMIIYRHELKIRGYLFMATALFVICAPAELYLMTIDWNIMSMFSNRLSIDGVVTEAILPLFIKRLITFSPLGLLSLLSHITMVVLLAWRPLDTSTK